MPFETTKAAIQALARTLYREGIPLMGNWCSVLLEYVGMLQDTGMDPYKVGSTHVTHPPAKSFRVQTLCQKLRTLLEPFIVADPSLWEKEGITLPRKEPPALDLTSSGVDSGVDWERAFKVLAQGALLPQPIQYQAKVDALAKHLDKKVPGVFAQTLRDIAKRMEPSDVV